MTQRRVSKIEPAGEPTGKSGGDALTRLIDELGRAAQAGWGPTARWLVFLLVITGALATVAAVTH